jgi:hypothetical protein
MFIFDPIALDAHLKTLARDVEKEHLAEKFLRARREQRKTQPETRRKTTRK